MTGRAAEHGARAAVLGAPARPDRHAQHAAEPRASRSPTSCASRSRCRRAAAACSTASRSRPPPSGSRRWPQGEERFVDALRALDEERATDDPLNGLILSAGLTWREVELLRTLRNHLLQIRSHYNADTVNGVLLRNSQAAGALFRPSRRASIRPCPAIAAPPWPRPTPPSRARSTRSRSLAEDEVLRALANLMRGGAAHQLLPAAGAAGLLDQGRQPRGRGDAVAAAAVRDLRPLAAARGHPPARRQGGARRHPLERPPRRLPHRDPGPDEDPDGQELDHRAGRLEGRLRAEGRRAAAAGARRLPDRPLPRVRLRPARRHRQHRATARCCIRPRSCATTATIRTWWWPPTRAPRTSPTPPTASRRSTASGSATRSPRAAAPATTTRRSASRRAARGSASSTTSATSGIDVQTQPFTVAGIGDMSGDVFGNGVLLTRAIKLVAAFNHRHIFIDPDPDPEASFAERERLFDAAALELARLRHRADQRGRRRLRPLGQGDPAHARGAAAARASRPTAPAARR